MTDLQQVFNYEYYINIRKVNPEQAETYLKSFDKTKKEVKEEIKPIQTIEQKIELVESLIKPDIKPEISIDIKEVKRKLKEKGVSNASFLKPEEAMQKAKEIGL